MEGGEDDSTHADELIVGLHDSLAIIYTIAQGTVFDHALADNMFGVVMIPRDSLPPDRIIPRSDRALLEAYNGKVAATDIFAGTPVVAGQFVLSSQPTNTIAAAIPKGKQAITVNLDQTHAVGGFVTPGDKVNLLLNFTPKEGPRTTAFLLAGIEVIAVGPTTILPSADSSGPNASAGGSTSTTPPQSQPSNLITLEVTPRQAEQIAQATTIGTLYLTLNPPDFKIGQFKIPPEVVEADNLLDPTREP